MKCPGQDTQYWKPGAIFEVKCPECNATVEFFKDDTSRKCPGCGHRFVNPKMDFGCAAYCQYAEQCLGDLPPELIAQKEDFLKDRVAVEMKRYFRTDFKQISHATRVARYAERIGKEERGNLAVILSSAYLHDIGVIEAERKHGSRDAKYQELEGPLVARDILTTLGAPEGIVEEVCDIVGRHHHPGLDETMTFKIVYDADRIANLEERHKDTPMDAADLRRRIETELLTDTGRQVAKQVLIPE